MCFRQHSRLTNSNGFVSKQIIKHMAAAYLKFRYFAVIKRPNNILPKLKKNLIAI